MRRTEPSAEREGLDRSSLSALSDKINKICEGLLFILMTAMIAITTLQIVFRFFFEALVWSEELTRFLLVASSLVGASIGFKRGSHIAITFLANKLSPKASKALGVFIQLASMAFFVIVGWYGILMMKSEGGQTTPALGISMAWIYLFYPAVSLVIMVHLLDSLLKILRRD
ncbi:Tripartite ATP-independent periplasmic transporter DctQ component [Thermovirga lienii DSM 17291]|jgi:TRAP-type C4-dicarboxylate transport system permease small subunit|uniref:Tripartite ATP-independent periplasmic transporter DctQ component n=1 Tax=Thermovirga lienii (strain ATCC BAA-1197 / DSM 17291 / Cas60314) TaxID=580340 RepID=G7V5E9_THELD|nr:TRAP transporter small permease [Thermovirga lienii]AER65776.1 Tripartite ATP-independent periplasmic transporter DctQ component [Thermovirga lienii DSM 17291]MDN5318868.1 hypothetical protein [Thermovirga sp.]